MADDIFSVPFYYSFRRKQDKALEKELLSSEDHKKWKNDSFRQNSGYPSEKDLPGRYYY